MQAEAFVASKLPITYNPQVSLLHTEVCISYQHFLLAGMYVQLHIYAFLVARIHDSVGWDVCSVAHICHFSCTYSLDSQCVRFANHNFNLVECMFSFGYNACLVG